MLILYYYTITNTWHTTYTHIKQNNKYRCWQSQRETALHKTANIITNNSDILAKSMDNPEYVAHKKQMYQAEIAKKDNSKYPAKVTSTVQKNREAIPSESLVNFRKSAGNVWQKTNWALNNYHTRHRYCKYTMRKTSWKESTIRTVSTN